MPKKCQKNALTALIEASERMAATLNKNICMHRAIGQQQKLFFIGRHYYVDIDISMLYKTRTKKAPFKRGFFLFSINLYHEMLFYEHLDQGKPYAGVQSLVLFLHVHQVGCMQ